MANETRAQVGGEYLYYKDKPLVREGNTICYGDMNEPCILILEIMSYVKNDKGEEVLDHPQFTTAQKSADYGGNGGRKRAGTPRSCAKIPSGGKRKRVRRSEQRDCGTQPDGASFLCKSRGGRASCHHR